MSRHVAFSYRATARDLDITHKFARHLTKRKRPVRSPAEMREVPGFIGFLAPLPLGGGRK